MRSPLLHVALFIPGLLYGADPDGAGIYKRACAECHDAGLPRVPTREGLKALSAEGVKRSLISGAMRFQGTYLTPSERHAIAEFVTGKKLDVGVGASGLC